MRGASYRDHNLIYSGGNNATEKTSHAYARFTLTNNTVTNKHTAPQLIPPSLIEWGQQPNHLESLSSSTYAPSPLPTLRSETLTVYPETGCAADNLSFSYKSSDVNLNDSLKFDTSLLGVISTSVSSPPSMKHPNNRVISLKTEFVDGRDKLTVEFNVIAKLKIIVGDIKFTSSKKVTNTALFPNAFLSDLKAAGGLDAQTLSKIKGTTTPTNNHYDVINVKKPTLLKHLNAPYTRSFATPSKTLTGSTPFNLIGVGKVAGVKYDDSLRLPGGIIIRLVDGGGKWGVEVVRLVVKEDDEEGGRFFEKTVIERNFGKGGEQLKDVKFWREERREKN